MANKAKIKVFDIGKTSAIYIPQSLRKDSLYPFSEDEEKNLVIEIKGKQLIVRTCREDELNE